MMTKQYQTPELEIVPLPVSDFLADSSFEDDNKDDGYGKIQPFDK